MDVIMQSQKRNGGKDLVGQEIMIMKDLPTVVFIKILEGLEELVISF